MNHTPNRIQSDKCRVFVVHGRNEEAKTAAFTFLRSLQLHPLEWSQAADLVHKASPTTLEIVQAGLENSQCIVVLFTGDDIAHLNESFGAEPPALQPRPNVLFECGAALAVAGQERTVILSFGSLRGFSDIEGLNFISVNNDAKTRRAIVQRLKAAGCELEDSGSDYLGPERGGDFEHVVVRQSQPHVKGGAHYSEFIGNAAFYLGKSVMDLHDQLENSLRSGQPIQLKYHYVGAFCARRWLGLSRHPAYGHQALNRLIFDNIPVALNVISRISPNQPYLSVVTLGCGDGETDRHFLTAVTEMEQFEVCSYAAVDISYELLHATMRKINRESYLRNKFVSRAVVCDFEDLGRMRSVLRTEKETVTIFLLTGFTLGNYNENELLQAIRLGMNRGDFLFLDARLHNLEHEGDEQIPSNQERLKKAYAHALNNSFAFGPVEFVTEASASAQRFAYEITSRNTVVPCGVNVITSCENLDTTLRSTGEQIQIDRLELASTTLYSFSSLRKWLSEHGFQVVWEKATPEVGLFLLLKTA